MSEAAVFTLWPKINGAYRWLMSWSRSWPLANSRRMSEPAFFTLWPKINGAYRW